MDRATAAAAPPRRCATVAPSCAARVVRSRWLRGCACAVRRAHLRGRRWGAPAPVPASRRVRSSKPKQALKACPPSAAHVPCAALCTQNFATVQLAASGWLATGWRSTHPHAHTGHRSPLLASLAPSPVARGYETVLPHGRVDEAVHLGHQQRYLGAELVDSPPVVHRHVQRARGHVGWL